MKRFSLTFSVAAVLLLSIYLFYPQERQASANITDIEQLVPALMKEAAIPGLAIAKIEFGEIAYTGTFGFANLATGQRVTNNTLFNIASISKPVMGLTLLQLADEGKVNLDEEINQYLSFNIDNPHVNNEAITLRHLASHSSGIADYYDIESYSINADPAVSLKEHISNLLLKEGSQYDKGAHYLNQLPGEYRQYSNLGAALAGQIVEEVTGYPLAEYSKMSLFTSLNMPSTSWLLNDLDLAEIATPYEVEQCIPWLFICANSEDVELNHLINKYITPPDTYKSFLPYPHFGNPQYPDGGMRTNIIELSRFVKHMLANKDAFGKPLLSDAMFQEMFRLQLAPEISDSQRFFWRDRNGLTGHMGSDLGVFTALYFDRESKTGFIVLMNRGMDSSSGYAMKRIADTLMGTQFMKTED